jgi:hypothetical protein
MTGTRPGDQPSQSKWLEKTEPPITLWLDEAAFGWPAVIRRLATSRL